MATLSFGDSDIAFGYKKAKGNPHGLPNTYYTKTL